MNRRLASALAAFLLIVAVGLAWGRSTSFTGRTGGGAVSSVTGAGSVSCSPTTGDITCTGSGGGGSLLTTTLTADTNLAAGTTISLDSSGHAVQTWGPAPNITGAVSLLLGNTRTGGYIETLILDATHFVSFAIVGATAPGAQAGTISGEAISLGPIDTSVPNTAVIDWGPQNSYVTAGALSGSLYVIAYNDTTSGFFNLAAVSISSNTLSPGAPIQIDTQALASPIGNLAPASIISLSATEFIAGYTLADTTCWVVYGSVSGNTITLGTPVELTATGHSGPTLAPLSSSSFLASYDIGGGAGSFVVGTVAATVITLGTPAGPTTLTDPQITLLSNTLFAASDSASVGGKGVIAGTLIGPAITLGSASAAFGNYGFVYALDASSVVFQVGAGSGNQVGSPLVLGISGTTFSLVAGAQYLSLSDIVTGNGYPSTNGPVAVLSSSLFALTDSNFRIYEESSAGTLSLPIQHQGMTGYWLYPLDATHALATFQDAYANGFARVIAAEPINSGPIGFVAAAVTSGNPATVIMQGVATGFTGLTPGTEYFANGDGTLTTGNTGHAAGKALSATTLAVGLSP